MTALARTRSNCKQQTRPLVREGAPSQQTHNCQTVIKSGRKHRMGALFQERLASWPSVVTWDSDSDSDSRNPPCGGGVEYLHRDLASRRRRRKGKSRIWGSIIWPSVLRDSDTKMTSLARFSSNFKRQTRLLVREGAPNQQTRNCQTIIKIWSQAPEGCFIPRQTSRLTVGCNIRLRLRYERGHG
jgi:hypothetical protein